MKRTLRWSLPVLSCGMWAALPLIALRRNPPLFGKSLRCCVILLKLRQQQQRKTATQTQMASSRLHRSCSCKREKSCHPVTLKCPNRIQMWLKCAAVRYSLLSYDHKLKLLHGNFIHSVRRSKPSCHSKGWCFPGCYSDTQRVRRYLITHWPPREIIVS